MLILVSGSTASVRRRAEQSKANIGILLTPANGNSVAKTCATSLPWAIDNGAFSGFDRDRFRRLLRKAETMPGLLWVVAPDVVGSAKQTLALWPKWSDEIREREMPVAFVLQDGQEDCELPDADAYFIGGSTEWKLGRNAADIVAGVKAVGKWVHMGRVNSYRRLRYAHDLGCDSVDGSSLSMFGDRYIGVFCRWARQLEEQQTLDFSGSREEHGIPESSSAAG